MIVNMGNFMLCVFTTVKKITGKKNPKRIQASEWLLKNYLTKCYRECKALENRIYCLRKCNMVQPLWKMIQHFCTRYTYSMAFQSLLSI